MPKMKWMKPKKPQLHVVSLSGGKDSTAMLLRMVEEGMRIDLIIFCDTGLEFPAMYRHLEKLERDIGMKVVHMVKLEMERRKTEKEKAVGNTRYTSKYPFSGILICGTCGSRLRRHVRKTGSGKLVPSWGCSNRILNGREVCNSYHVNEDVLYATYHAAVQAMVEDAGSILSTLESATEKELQPSNKAALDEVEQKIIDLQEKVLALHRQKRAQAVNDAYYNAQVNDYSQQLAALEDRQQALQTADARYATVRMWLADFQQHMQEGDATDDRDGKMMKSLVESIIIWPDRMEIHFKCGVNIEQKYVK